MIGQDFYSDYSIEARVASAINLTHPARAKRGENFVRAELCAHSEHHFFLSAAVQFTTSISGLDDEVSPALLIRKRWPSGEMS